MKRILKGLLKCPILIIILAMWGGLTFLTWQEGKMPVAMEQNLVQNPVFAVLLNPKTELPEIELPDPDKEVPVIAGLEREDDTDGFGTDKQKQPDGKDGGHDGKPGGADASDKKDGKGGKQDGASDGKPDSASGGKQDGKNGQSSGRQGGKDSQSGGKTDGKSGGKQDGGQGSTQKAGVTRFQEYQKVKTDSPYYSDPGVKALTTDYAYKNVQKDYFDDALFIGDSRTVGMQDYSGLDNAAFFAKTGMNVYELLEDKFIKDGGRDVSVSYMLKRYKYKKIYLMIGINELGTGNTATFQKAYARVLEKFRKWQPEAVIYIQGIIPVSKKKAESDGIFNNVNINDKNVAIAQLADGEHIFYLDVSEKLVDKKGFLREDYTFDDVHMYAQNYRIWTDYLMEHAVVGR